MPFGCLALRDGRTYNSLSDVTDKYEIGQVLKAKEFCELCLVKERQTDKVYVCKKFLKKDGRKVRKAAKNEIMILKMVKHPNILQLIDAFETRKEFFIIQELATGGDVFDWILDQGNYTERDAANVIRQVLEAVAYLHSLNIVHRNLKLENLMYYRESNHNKVVLRDFYLSRFENGSITEPCGTPEYLAPEVVARHRYGRPVDCWAVGVIMYILLSGNPPFYDETEEENTDMHNRIIFCRIVAGEFEFDSPYWDEISPAAKELVCKLMEVDPMLRITAQDALLHGWIAGNGASEKNLKEGVCAQFEKNFAKAKWRVRGIYYHTQQSCTTCQVPLVTVLITLLENGTINNRITDKDSTVKIVIHPPPPPKLLKCPSPMYSSHECDRYGKLQPQTATLLTIHFTSIAKKTSCYFIIY
uniref:CaM kinase-like vesicle-associated protein n=1 Tax=Cyprinus carpio TaxID=7962 RepID=A0A8C1L471_CYPCA